MSLQSKVIAILAVLVGLLTIFQFAIQRLVLEPSFEDLEVRQAQEDVQRIVEALDNDAAHLRGLCHDWASWDDTYDYVVSRDPVYAEGNLQVETLDNNQLTVIYIVGVDGEVVARLMREPDEGEECSVLTELPVGHLPLDDPLHATDSLGAGLSGVFVTREGPMLLASRPILTSAGEGPVRGTLVMGRLIDAGVLQRFRDQTKVNFALECLPMGKLGAARGAEVERLAAESDAEITALDERMNEALGLVRDLIGRPALIVRAWIPRDVTQEGAGTLRFAILSTGGATLMTLLVVLFLLQRAVVNPLIALTRHTIAIGANGDLGARLRSGRKDEIGLLSGEIDAMMERLESSHAQLVSAARLAGMSEVATNVLHDVGNALNGVNVSAEVVRKKLDALCIADLERMSERLRAHESDLGAFLTADPKGKKYPAYLELLARNLRDERAALVVEAKAIFEGLGHIKALVRSQQDLAGNSEGLQSLSPASEMEAALRISGAGAGDLDIVREFDAPASIRVQRHRLLQILINLIKNARQAIEEREPVSKRLVLRVRPSDDGRNLRFEVEDNGVGIAQENVLAVFQRGFTTRPTGNGIGLHSAANLAKDMRGRIFIESTCVGEGSTFVLELPLDAEPTAAAA